ncbi:MAG: SH3 domain-containing protein, partial [Lachnospiraceae bacterium]|nr:SH3 domain-containing protein [Lachnospiraceae bacterium]
MKKAICFATILSLTIWGLAGVKALAFTPTNAKVKDKGINIRSEAGASGQVISSAAAGSSLYITDSVTGTDGRTWYVVDISGGKKGYIRGDLLTLEDASAVSTQNAATDVQAPSSADPAKTGATDTAGAPQAGDSGQVEGKAKVKGTGVRIRSSNSTTSAIVTVAPNNTKLTLLQKTTGADARTWYQVSLKSGGKKLVGYIRSDLIKIVKEKKATDEPATDPVQPSVVNASGGAVKGVNVNVRMQPVSGLSICKLSTGHTVSVVRTEKGSDQKDWYYIQFTYGGVAQEGYIRSDFVVVETGQVTEVAQSEQLSNTSAVIRGVNVRIRQSAVGGTVICQQSDGFPLTLVGEMSGSDQKTWYEVEFSYQGETKSGYVRSDFVKLSQEENTAVSDTQFEALLDEQGFPESYRVYLRALHGKHPNWSFRGVATGLVWADAVTAESRVGKNFVPHTSIAAYKSVESTAYNYKEDKWYRFDGGSWVAASRAAVEYYMDPRNFLNESGIYQFETLEYKEYQTAERLAGMLSSGFMKGEYEEPDGTRASYAQTLA